MIQKRAQSPNKQLIYRSEQNYIDIKDEVAYLKSRLEVLEVGYKHQQNTFCQLSLTPSLKKEETNNTYLSQTVQFQFSNDQYKRNKTDISPIRQNDLKKINKTHNDLTPGNRGKNTQVRDFNQSPLSQNQQRKSPSERLSTGKNIENSQFRNSFFNLEIEQSKQEQELQRLYYKIIYQDFKYHQTKLKNYHLKTIQDKSDQKQKQIEMISQEMKQKFSREIDELIQTTQDLRKEFLLKKDHLKADLTKLFDQQLKRQSENDQIMQINQKVTIIEEKINKIQFQIKQQHHTPKEQSKQNMNFQQKQDKSYQNIKQSEFNEILKIPQCDNFQNLDNKFMASSYQLNDEQQEIIQRISTLEDWKDSMIKNKNIRPQNNESKANQVKSQQDYFQAKFKKQEQIFNSRIIEQNNAFQKLLDCEGKDIFIKLIIERLEPHIKFQNEQIYRNEKFTKELKRLEEMYEEIKSLLIKIQDEKQNWQLAYKQLERKIESQLEQKYLSSSQLYQVDLQFKKKADNQLDQKTNLINEQNQIGDVKNIEDKKVIQIMLTNPQHPDPKRLKAIQDLINDIYNQSWRKRSASGEFLKFIRDEQNLNEFYKNYGIRQLELKGQLAQICNSFREVRGDGNCFYTAFGFQFLNILLYNYQLIEYQQFIQNMDEIITFKINYGEGKSIEAQELQQYFWNEFKYRLNYLRNQNKDELIKHFQAYEQSSDNILIDGCFYGLSTIFFRNLANYLIDRSDMKQAVLDQQNLLIWEEECNSNEVVIQELAKYLQVHVKLIFFEQGSFQLRQYSQEMKSQIILLIRPGHYNIGLLKKNLNQNSQYDII